MRYESHEIGVRKAKDDVFWKFLQLKSDSGGGFCLLDLLNQQKDEVKRGELLGHLLRAQAAAVAEFFYEKLRGSDGVQIAKERLPSYLKFSDFLDEKRWLLGSIRYFSIFILPF